MAVIPSSRTPEGEPNECPICGHAVQIAPSRPPGDAPCPHCGHLLWFAASEAWPIQGHRRSLALAEVDPAGVASRKTERGRRLIPWSHRATAVTAGLLCAASWGNLLAGGLFGPRDSRLIEARPGFTLLCFVAYLVTWGWYEFKVARRKDDMHALNAGASK